MTVMNCSMCGDALPMDNGDAELCKRCEREESQPASLGDNGLNPNLLLALALAISTGIGFYALGPFLLLRDTGFAHLFCGHGWVPYACVALFFTALSILLLKIPLIRRQRAAFDLQLLLTSIDARIEVSDTRRIIASRISARVYRRY